MVKTKAKKKKKITESKTITMCSIIKHQVLFSTPWSAESPVLTAICKVVISALFPGKGSEVRK